MRDLSCYIENHKFIPVICGPTASGKSSLALKLCEEENGELVSCDSMQIYKGLDIGTAKDTAEEQQRIKHHMIDIVDPDVNYSVNDYVTDALKCIEEILKRGKLPVLCGGTGQYISALVKGLDFGSEEVSDKTVSELYAEYERDGIDDIYNRLSKVDPEAAENIHPNNVRRVIRAYAVFVDTGITFTEKNRRSELNGPEYPFRLFLPQWPREELYSRINDRVDEMVSSGLVDEAQWLYSNYGSSGSTSLQAIGYKELFPYLNGDISLDRAVYEIKLNTRHYAKRQMTWFRKMDVYYINMPEKNKLTDKWYDLS